MKISIVIAIYNGSAFIEKALESCHHFDCVSEIVIVDDGSQDDSYKKSLSLRKEYHKIKVFQHENVVNKGAGASWNLGIQKAQNEWIAILGVDDVFLPNRFDKELKLYNSKINFDGVYGSMGVYYFSETGKEKFKSIFNNETTTVSKIIKPEKLKYTLLQMSKSSHGYFSLNSLTVKKELLLKVGLLNEKLRLHQDTDLIVKLSCMGTLISGNITEAISLRGVHDNNRITSSALGFNSRLLMYEEMYKWAKENVKDQKILTKLKTDVETYWFLERNKTYSIFKAFTFVKHRNYIFYSERHFNLLIKNSNSNKRLKTFIIRLKEKIILSFFKEKQTKYSLFVD